MVDVTKIDKEYHCQWCGNVFTRSVGYAAGGSNMTKNPPVPGKKGALSDQVKCHKCGNFIPTWDKIELGDGKSIKVRR